MIADLDSDRDLDVYVANDATPNHLLRNDGQGELTNVGLESGSALSDRFEADGSMGLAMTDYNHGGLPDIAVTNYENQHLALYRNDGDLLFTHVSAAAGLAKAGDLFVGFGMRFADFDLDGHADLIATNGHVLYSSPNAPLAQLPLLFRNNGAKTFERIRSLAGPYFESAHVGRGLATGDLDDDGDPDVLISHSNEPMTLLRNDQSSSSHWLKVTLASTRSHRDAIGAIIRLELGERALVHHLLAGGSYLSSSASQTIVGLGQSTVSPSMEIHWPSGLVERFENIPVDSSVMITESIGLSRLP